MELIVDYEEEYPDDDDRVAEVGARRQKRVCFGPDLLHGERLAEEVFHTGWVLPEDSDLARQASRALRDTGQTGAFFHAPYCTNGSCCAGERGIPSIIYGCGHIRDAHVVDEGLDEEQLLGALRGYRALARALSRVPLTAG